MTPNVALWSDEERWHILMDNIRDYAIFMLDSSGHIVTWSLGDGLRCSR